jgi:predicted Zn-dependent peptidase
MEKMREIDSVSLGIFVKAGAINETPEESGVSHYIEHMMFKGTSKRSAKDISEEIDNEGGNINAYTSRSKTVYYVKMLSDKIEKGIDILSDMILNSNFNQEELDKERKVIVEEIKMYEDIPEETVHDENIRRVINGIYGNTILGTEESLNGIERANFIKYYKDMYKPTNMVISVVGNIDFDKIYNQINKKFGKFKNSAKERKYNKDFEILTGENIIKRKTSQVHLCVNTRDLSIIDERRYASTIVSNILGGGMSSRLFQKIREERGLAYSIYSYGSNFIEGGIFTVYAGTTKKDHKKVIDIIKKEFYEIKKNGIEEKELERSKNQILSGLVFALENSRNKMEKTANSYILYGKIIKVRELVKQINKITMDDIAEIVDFMFDEKYYSSTILGDV